MSPFDVFPLDDRESEDAIERLDELVTAFRASPEAEVLAGRVDRTLIGWSASLFADYAIRGIGVPLARLTVADVAELLLDMFPRKVVMKTDEEADEALRQIVALWRSLDRTWKPERAGAIMAMVEALGPKFRESMRDEALWGPGKRFMLSGIRAGYDMSDPRQSEAYSRSYNASLTTASRKRLLATAGASPSRDVVRAREKGGAEEKNGEVVEAEEPEEVTAGF